MRRILIVAAAIVVALAVTAARGELPNPPNPYSRDVLEDELSRGFVRAIRSESPVWWECGERTPPARWLGRATRMIRELLSALDEFGVDASPWGVAATVWHESRGNRCSIGPHPREYAVERGIVEGPKNLHLWTEGEIRATLDDPRWGNRTADLGLSQTVWRRFARLPCEPGSEGCSLERGLWVRVPSIDEMLSVRGGARVAAYGMYLRQRATRHSHPWLFWPGMQADYGFGREIALIVKRMGGPVREVW